jgi:hypothetical protein
LARLIIDINKRLFSIKRLVHLATSVRIQFFKTFILPYFDYCSSLSAYYTKTLVQKFCNMFYFCLYKLFSIKFDSNIQLSYVFDYLRKYNILPIQYRLFMRISSVVHKVYHFNQPIHLYNCINNQLKQTNTRSMEIYRIPFAYTKFGCRSFTYVATNILNWFKDPFSLTTKDYKTWLYNNFNDSYSTFIKLFSNMDTQVKMFVKKKKNTN